jgi:apolipoprotein N-acyltransferase
VVKVPLRSTITLATRLGAADEWALVAGGLLALAVAVAQGVRRRRVSGKSTGQANEVVG